MSAADSSTVTIFRAGVYISVDASTTLYDYYHRRFENFDVAWISNGVYRVKRKWLIVDASYRGGRHESYPTSHDVGTLDGIIASAPAALEHIMKPWGPGNVELWEVEEDAR